MRSCLGTQPSEKILRLSMKAILADYFNQIHKIDLTTNYGEVISHFVKYPDIPQLFADYWRLYISVLPEAVFQKVNENFYRTTFYNMCRQYLSGYFTIEVAKSYAIGRTNMEFIGKYHSNMANIRYLLEFKYNSNTKWDKVKTDISNGNIDGFQATDDDIKQINDYKAEWIKEYPKANNECFLIYCFGNQGFRVFEI